MKTYVPMRAKVMQEVINFLQDVQENPNTSYKAFVRSAILNTGCKEQMILDFLSLYDVEIVNDHAKKVVKS